MKEIVAVCQVCGDAVDLDSFECGHIIDRVVADRIGCPTSCVCVSLQSIKTPHRDERRIYRLGKRGRAYQTNYRVRQWPVHARARRSRSTTGRTCAPEVQSGMKRFEVRDSCATCAELANEPKEVQVP